MDLSLRISRIVCIFFLFTTPKSYSGTKTEEKKKQKSKNKDNGSMCRVKQTDENGDSETVIRKASSKNNNIFCIL